MDEEATYDFPDVNAADEEGLLAVGGNLSFGTLMNAYKSGIFPWYDPNEAIRWYSPDPRFVLFPGKIIISHSMRNVLNKHLFRFTVNKAFPQVIQNCRLAERKEQEGTWIGEDIENAYNNLFKKGFAHSAEAWQQGELVGGLYGVLIGKVFFGESMFANKSNASKFAFINWVEVLKKNGIKLIDCQVYTTHLQSLGGEFISRKEFTELLKELIV